MRQQTALDEINSLEREWRFTMGQPKGPERSRQLRLIQQQREGLWAKRRRELAGYTYGAGHPGSGIGQNGHAPQVGPDADHPIVEPLYQNGSTPHGVPVVQKSSVLEHTQNDPDQGLGEPSIPPQPEHDSLRDIETLVDNEFGTTTQTKTPEQLKRSEAMKAHWVRRRAKAARAG